MSGLSMMRIKLADECDEDKVRTEYYGGMSVINEWIE